MKTLETTHHGRFEIIWGIAPGDDVWTRAGFGSFDHFEPVCQTGSIRCRDPRYGEEKALFFYRLKDDHDHMVLLGEITAGIWAVGLRTDEAGI